MQFDIFWKISGLHNVLNLILDNLVLAGINLK